MKCPHCNYYSDEYRPGIAGGFWILNLEKLTRDGEPPNTYAKLHACPACEKTFIVPE